MRGIVGMGIGAAVLTMAIGIGLSAQGSPPASRILEVVSEATTINHFIDLGDPGWSPGDTYTFSDKLLDPNDLSRQIGRADGHCTLVQPPPEGFRWTCTITSSFPDGDITTEGTLVFVPFQENTAAITGGTGAYRNVRGEATLSLGPVVGQPGAQHDVEYRLILVS